MALIKRLAALFNANTPWNQPVSALLPGGAATTILSREALQALTDLGNATDDLRDPPRIDRAGTDTVGVGTNPTDAAITFPVAGDFLRNFDEASGALVTLLAGTYLLTVGAQFTVATISEAALVIKRNGAEYRRMTQAATSPSFGGYWSTLVQASAGDRWSIAAAFPTGGAVTVLPGRRLQLLRMALA